MPSDSWLIILIEYNDELFCSQIVTCTYEVINSPKGFLISVQNLEKVVTISEGFFYQGFEY